MASGMSPGLGGSESSSLLTTVTPTSTSVIRIREAVIAHAPPSSMDMDEPELLPLRPESLPVEPLPLPPLEVPLDMPLEDAAPMREPLEPLPPLAPPSEDPARCPPSALPLDPLDGATGLPESASHAEEDVPGVLHAPASAK